MGRLYRTLPGLARLAHPIKGSLPAGRKGERFRRGEHASGTEIKAITYSAMQIREEPGDAEVFVIVDI